jgi:hypothetical protein
VDVLLAADTVIRRCTMAEVGVGDEAELLQELQRAVDGRDVDTFGGLPHLSHDLVGSGMPKPVDRLEHELSLRGQPVAARAEA